MTETALVCIGSGNMGRALMKGAAAGGVSITFTDRTFAKAEAAAGAVGGGACRSNTEAAERGDFIFLAVKPQALARALKEIAPAVRRRLRRGVGGAPVLVSMAAGWSIEAVGRAIGAPVPVARIMPNTPALISRGVIAFCPSPEVPPEKAALLERILQSAGLVERVEERYMDAVTGLSGSGPAFVYLFIEALADGGVLAGLPRSQALRFAAQTAAGAAAMVLETGAHPGELKDMVASPGGTTIESVAALEAGAFRGTVINAVRAAWEKSKAMTL